MRTFLYKWRLFLNFFFSVTAKRVAQFTWHFHSSDIFIKRVKKYLSFDFIVRDFVLVLVGMSISLKVTVTRLYRLSWNWESIFLVQRWAELYVRIFIASRFNMAAILWVVIKVTDVEWGPLFTVLLVEYIVRQISSCTFIKVYFILFETETVNIQL